LSAHGVGWPRDHMLCAKKACRPKQSQCRICSAHSSTRRKSASTLAKYVMKRAACAPSITR
jgi:hypothetical protein